jgi:multimeric flavodoxin WrbA
MRRLETMRYVLGVVGSPRKKGNTDVMVSRILEGARDSGAHTEAIFLADMMIRECDGCHACWRGKRVCVKKDDMTLLYPKIAKSDAIVLGTPVYWYGPTALMKGFIDRFVYFNSAANRKQVKDKLAVIAIPFEDSTPATSDLVVDFFDKSLTYLEMRLIDKILAPGVTKRGESATGSGSWRGATSGESHWPLSVSKRRSRRNNDRQQHAPQRFRL